MTRQGRYMKVSKLSDGYKRGIRWIDFGEKQSDKIKYLKKKPRSKKK
jgi:hypothetical protein